MERPRRLSAAFVNTIVTPGRYGDGRGGLGLSLLVKPTRSGRVSRTWAQRLRVDDQPVNIGLGSFPTVTLARARELALSNARTVEQGGDPRRKPQATPTFEESLELTIEVLRSRWKNAKTEKNLRAVTGEYVLPVIGRRPIDAITPAEILGFLAPLALQKPSIAKKAKMGLSQTFKWAIAHGLRPDNPADQNISSGLPKLSTKVHHRALPYSQVGAALRIVASSNAWLGTKLAFEFLVLTAARSGEVRGATWDEVDLEAATWTIPATRMKSGREHRIPLSAPALDVLREARPLSGGQGLVFPSPSDKPLTDSTISKLLRENDVQAVPHGFRSSFRDWCAEANIDRHVAESALAHSVGDATEAAYLRSDMFALRRAAMDSWGLYLLLVPLLLAEAYTSCFAITPRHWVTLRCRVRS